MGEVAAVLEAVLEGARMAGGGVGEAMGEPRASSLVGDAGEAVMGVAGESAVGTRGGGVAHRGRLLEKVPPPRLLARKVATMPS